MAKKEPAIREQLGQPAEVERYLLSPFRDDGQFAPIVVRVSKASDAAAHSRATFCVLLIPPIERTA